MAILVIDTFDWLTAYPNARAVEEALEWADVADKEYEVCDDAGRVYKLVADESGVHAEPLDTVDAARPFQYLARFAATYGFRSDAATDLLNRLGDWNTAIDYVTSHGKWRRPRR